MDVPRAAKDFSELNFLVYHSGFRNLQESLPAAAELFKTNAHVPWVSDLCAWKRKNPQVSNIYMEMGSTFAFMVSASPMLAAHVLGMIIDAFGDDHLLWGTDSVWWGSPQWQIEAFRRLEMPIELTQRFGWKPLTAEVKRRVFGLNAPVSTASIQPPSVIQCPPISSRSCATGTNNPLRQHPATRNMAGCAPIHSRLRPSNKDTKREAENQKKGCRLLGGRD